MGYIEGLKNGPPYHRVTLTSRGGFMIQAANNTPECKEQFHRIAEKAVTSGPSEGYRVKAHSSAMDPKGRYDRADITIAG